MLRQVATAALQAAGCRLAGQSIVTQRVYIRQQTCHRCLTIIGGRNWYHCPLVVFTSYQKRKVFVNSVRQIVDKQQASQFHGEILWQRYLKDPFDEERGRSIVEHGCQVCGRAVQLCSTAALQRSRGRDVTCSWGPRRPRVPATCRA